jgi:formate dehydrogenase major subunit
MKQVNITIDGQSVSVSEGTSALEALRSIGLEVPTACNDSRLEPIGACRFCLVKLKGINRPVASCALQVTDGMEFEVDTPKLQADRKAALLLQAKSYPNEAASQFPEKEFHFWLRQYGITPEAKSSGKFDDTNPYYRFDPEACIQCFRCVRICDEIQGTFVWNIMGRGSNTEVVPDSMASLIESSCKSCGACADACPTGALVDKTRLETGQPDKWTRTTCPYCGVGCELSVGTCGDQIVQVLPVLDAPVNKGHLCVKGRYAHQFVHAADRLTTPLIRRNGKLEPCTWDEAISTVATEFARIQSEYGNDRIGVLGSARAPNEDNYLAQKFARVVLQTNNVDCCARVCHGPTAAAMKVMLGTGAATNSYDDIELAGAIMIVGANPTENHPVIGQRIVQACRKGAKLVVIDPRRTELAEMADVHIQLRPGTNVPLLNAMAFTIFEENLFDAPYLERRTDGLESFREFVRDFSPESVADIVGVEAKTIREAARLYANSKPAMAMHGLGMTEHYQGTEGIQCLVNLALMTGNIGIPGAGINPLRGQNNVQGSAHMGCEPSNLTGFVSIPEGKERFSLAWGTAIPERPGLNLMQMLDAGGTGELKSMWVIGYDVLQTNPSIETTRKDLKAMEFIIVQDMFLNETALEFAHIVFPASSSFERDGTFMNAERRVQRVRGAIPPVCDSKPDWVIIQEVAQAMGHRTGFDFQSEEEIWEEIRKVWLPGAGITYSRLEQGGIQWPCLSEDHPGTKILHREKFTLGDRAALQEIPFLPSSEQTDAEFPFLLNSGRTLYQFNAATMTDRTKNKQLRPTDTLDIHPEDAMRLAVSNGDKIRVTSKFGSAVLPARIDKGVRKMELFATFHSREILLNLLTSQVRDRKTGTPEFKRTAVRIEKV